MAEGRAVPPALSWLESAPAWVTTAARTIIVPPQVGAVVHAATGEIIGANDEACDLLGLSWEALIGRTSIDPRWAAVSESGFPLPGPQHPAMRTLADGRPVAGFLMGVLIPAPIGAPYATGGRTRWIEIETVPLYADATVADREGPPGAVVALFVDLTGSERARVATDALLSSYRLLGDSAPGLVLRVDRHGDIVQAAASAGLEPRSIEGEAVVERLHPDDREEFTSFWHRLITHVSSPRQLQCRWRDHEGRYRSTILQATPIYDSTGGVSGAAIGLQDVHDIRLSRARVGELQAQLDWQRALAEVAVEGAELATWDWNVTTGEARFNARWSEIIGYSSDDLMPSAGTWAEQTHPADVPRVKEMLRLVTEGLAPHYELQSRRLHRDGHWVWTRDFGSVTERDEAGRPIRISGIQEDISSRVRAQEELAASERHYRLLAENMSDAVWVVDAQGLITWVSDSSRRLLGWWSEHVVGREFTRLVHPDDRTDARRLLTAGAGGLSVGECRLRCADGSHRVVALSSTLSESGTETVVALHDVNSEVAARRALARASASDSLTGLANRAQVVQTAKEAVARLAESWHQGGSGTVAILVVGVDGLTAVNDALTHAGGDELLREVGQRLRGQLPTIGRGSGDEFVAVVEGARSRADLATMAEQLRTAAKGGVDLGGEVVFPTVSIGIATAGPGSNPEEILRDAATAMRAAKGQGRDQVAFIADDQASVARQRLHLEADIRRGLPAGEFAAWYQPVVALESGRTVGFEALVRWETASAQVIAPDSFLPVAERSTLIVEIDRAMLRQVVEFLARMPANLTVAANVSGRTLGEPGYFQAVEDELQRWGVAPHRLHLEVTETSLPGITDVTMQQVERLADLGVKWFADDFGTGYSSIAMLRDLPISGLKLDRSFTNRIGRGDPTSEQLARAIAGLAQEVGIDSVAEGVESEAEASVLLGQGWRHAQGWLYGRPARSPELG